jgi:hypothetical protein
MAEDAYLVALKDSKGAPSGYYRCSLCNAVFPSDQPNPAEMAVNFSIHVRRVHRGQKARIESISETAKRVVEEAVRRLPKKK